MDAQVQRLVNAIGAVLSDLEEERQRTIAHERLGRQVLCSWSDAGDHAGNLAKVQGGYILSTWKKNTPLHEGNSDAFIPNEMIFQVINALQQTSAVGAT